MRTAVVFLVITLALGGCDKTETPAGPSAGKGYELSIQSNTYWKWCYEGCSNCGCNVGNGNRVQGISTKTHPTCITITNERATGSMTVSILKDGAIIDASTTSKPYGEITVCTD